MCITSGLHTPSIPRPAATHLIRGKPVISSPSSSFPSPPPSSSLPPSSSPHPGCMSEKQQSASVAHWRGCRLVGPISARNMEQSSQPSRTATLFEQYACAAPVVGGR